MQPLTVASGKLEDAIVGNQDDYIAGRIEHRRADLAGFEMPVDLLPQLRVQIALDVSREILPNMLAVDSHARPPKRPLRLGANAFSRGASSFCSMARARCSRTFTAASLIPRTAAVSRISNSSMSRRTTMLR